jgi:hypothetical protein
VAETDPRMNFPHGARIPWPPYYDALLAIALGPFAPEEPAARSAWIERATASAPRIEGVLAVLVAAAAAWCIAGATAACVAGATIALCRGTINYGVIGTGDHHAWIALLAATSLAVLSRALRPDVLASRRASAVWGALLGLVAGAMVGSWVAALLYVVNLQLALGWMLWRRARQPMPGLAVLGLSAHAVAALVLLPAVLSSPWRDEFPWMTVNLSWLHEVELVLGALVFVPLALAGETRLASGTRAARLYPFAVAAALAALAGVCFALDLAPARGIREGFEWVSRVNSFMDTVLESRPLVGEGAEQGVLALALGYGVLALPLALAYGLWRAVRRGEDELTPWLVAVLALVPQALAQRRFADALAAPMAVVLGIAAARFVAVAATRAPRVPHFAFCTLATALAVLAQFPAVSSAWRSLSAPPDPNAGGPNDVAVAEREALQWIARHTDGSDSWSVLSHWDRGHSIEWAANAPSVATNFGSYIGVDSYRDPPSFFLSESPTAAREVLLRRKVRFVYVPAWMINVVGSMCRVAAPELRDEFLRTNAAGGTSVTERWFGTMLARLLLGGTSIAPSGLTFGTEPGPLGHLRLAFVTRQRNPRFPEPITGLPLPCGFVWEHVEGAIVEVRGTPGEKLALEFDVVFANAMYRPPWRATTTADASGVARLRVPYAIPAEGSDWSIENARWSFADKSGTPAIPESAVQSGATVELR